MSMRPAGYSYCTTAVPLLFILLLCSTTLHTLRVSQKSGGPENEGRSIGSVHAPFSWRVLISPISPDMLVGVVVLAIVGAHIIESQKSLDYGRHGGT